MLGFFRNLIKGAFIYGLGAIAGPIVGFFLLPVYTRFLTPSDYGILEALVTTSSIITIFLIFGMDNSLFRFSFDAKDEQYQKRVLATVSIFLWSLAILVTLILVLNADFISRLMFHHGGYTILVDITIVSAAVAAIYKIPMSMFRIHNQPTKYTVISVVQVLLTCSLCIFFVVFLKKGVLGVMAGTLMATTVATLLAYHLIRGHVSPGFSFGLLKSMLKYSIPIIPAGLALWILSLSDRYFLLAYSTTTELGLYSIGARFASIVSLAITAFTLAWPQAAFSVLGEDQHNRNKLYARTLTYFMFAGCSIVLALSLFGNELVALMTTEEFFGGAKVIPILGLGLVFNGCYTIFAIGMNITKKMRAIFLVTAIPAGLNLVLNYFLIPPYGMMGAAWATLISYVLMAFLSWRASERVYHIDYEWRSVSKVFLVMLAIFGVSRLVTFEQLYYSIPIKLGLVATYFAILYLMKFPTREEYKSLKEIFASFDLKLWREESAAGQNPSSSNGQDSIKQGEGDTKSEKNR
jgi:O-antigen/teichoic acid export membrane protein